MAWLTEAELKSRFGEKRIDELSDRGFDGNEDADALADAIARAESRIESKLRNRYAAAELPTDDSDASDALKDVVGSIAYYYLHDHFDNKPQSVTDILTDALSRLNDLARGGASLLLANAPAVDRSRSVIRTSKRSATLTDQPITLARLELWGR